jgi:hypothetical protein
MSRSKGDRMVLVDTFLWRKNNAGVYSRLSTRSTTTDETRASGAINEYANYIQNLPQGQAGRLRVGEGENPLTVRRRLVSAAQAMNIPLIIKRSGNDLYFWRADEGGEQPRPRRGRRPRMGRPHSFLPPTQFSETEAGVQERTQEETTAPDQPFSASEEVNHEAAL